MTGVGFWYSLPGGWISAAGGVAPAVTTASGPLPPSGWYRRPRSRSQRLREVAMADWWKWSVEWINCSCLFHNFNVYKTSSLNADWGKYVFVDHLNTLIPSPHLCTFRCSRARIGSGRSLRCRTLVGAEVNCQALPGTHRSRQWTYPRLRVRRH